MAAASNPIETFIWGAGGQKMSPEQVARQREIAAALMQSGMDYSPVSHWLQGAARASQGLVGGLKERWAGEAEQRGREGFQSQWDSVFGGSASPVAAALAGGGAGGGDFMDALINSESGGNWNALNSEGYGGRLQFGDARLADAARAGVIPAGVTGAAFSKMSPEQQQAVEAWHFNDIDQQAERLGINKYLGQTIAGVPINQNSIRSMAHLGGIGGVQKFVQSGGQYNPSDSNGTSLSNYGTRFGGMSGGGAPTQVAQAGGGQGVGNPSVAQLLSLAGNEWANPGQSSVVSALLGQAMQQQDPRYQQQLAMGDLDMQRAQLELDALRNPAAPFQPRTLTPEEMAQFGIPEGTGSWITTESGVPQQLYAPPDPTSGIQNFDFLTGQGFDPMDAASRAFSGGVTVNNAPSVPAPATGYQNVFDDQGRLVRQEVVEGGPVWQAQQDAAAATASQEGAQITSDIEKAGTTLAATQDILGLLDNSDGQPTTGTLSIPFGMYSGSPAGKIRSYVSTLQSGVALGAMQRLKEASATGATGFGALSAPELNLLISDIGALNPDNTEPAIFKQTIQRIDERAKRVVADIRRNVSPERITELGLTEFLDSIDPEGARQSTVDPSDIDALLELYR